MPTPLDDAELAPAPGSLAEIIERLPVEPGVYLMKDHQGKLLYIGKAASLRARVRQYFQPNTGDSRDFVPLLGTIVATIDTVITGNEKEALLLENTLIKRHKPRFNVKLRDDKNYLVLRLDPRAAWPRLEVVRGIGGDGASYFGPYHSASSCRQALRVVNRHFQLRTCTDHVLANRKRPCLQYQIKRCPAPCVLPVPAAEYADQVRDVGLFLDGKNDELLIRLQDRMNDSAAALAYERAAATRDQLAALRSTLEEQNVVSSDLLDQDVLGFHREGVALDIAVLAIRGGKMVGSRTFSFSDQEFPDAEILSTFVGLYYDLNPAVPDEILLPFAIGDTACKSEWLAELRARAAPPGSPQRRRKVEILLPQRGPRADLVELARKNAAASFVSRRGAERDLELTLARLQQRLKLARLPRVIECYDISHVQGTDTVASMVVFVDGKPDKSRYRTFKLARGVSGGHPDDFASMYEVLSRRLRRAREAEAGDGAESWRLPDLIVVDGGKGQLAMALAAARDIGIDTSPGAGLPIVALAKERDSEEPGAVPAETAPTTSRKPTESANGRRPDRVFLPHAKDAIPIRPNSAEMFVLQQLRDEAHRFAVTFHRAQRHKRTLRSSLSEIPGIGATRQKALLRHFGSLRKIRDATVGELAAVPGMTIAAAEATREFLDRLGPVAPAAVASAPEPAVGAEAAESDALESAFAAVEEEEGLPGDMESDESN